MKPSHALGATKTTSTGGTGSKALPIQQVASYLNEKVHDLSSNIIARYDEAPGDSFVLVEAVVLSHFTHC